MSSKWISHLIHIGNLTYMATCMPYDSSAVTGLADLKPWWYLTFLKLYLHWVRVKILVLCTLTKSFPAVYFLDSAFAKGSIILILTAVFQVCQHQPLWMGWSPKDTFSIKIFLGYWKRSFSKTPSYSEDLGFLPVYRKQLFCPALLFDDIFGALFVYASLFPSAAADKWQTSLKCCYF